MTRVGSQRHRKKKKKLQVVGLRTMKVLRYVALDVAFRLFGVLCVVLFVSYSTMV